MRGVGEVKRQMLLDPPIYSLITESLQAKSCYLLSSILIYKEMWSFQGYQTLKDENSVADP